MSTPNSPLISVVITTYNRERYLGDAIASVLRQTYRHFELLIWDDGSTDRSVALANEYARADRRVRVVAAKHQGRVPALKAAIAQTTGEYLGWVDSDDLLAPTALAETCAVLNTRSKVGWVYTDYLNIDSNNQVIDYGHRCQIPYSPNQLLVDFMTFHFRLVRRSVFEQAGGIDDTIGQVEDYDLSLRLSEIAAVDRVRKPLYYYRNHVENFTSCNPQKRARQLYWSREAIARALQRRGLSDRWQIDVKGGQFILRRRSVVLTPPTPIKATPTASLLLAALPLTGVITDQAYAVIAPVDTHSSINGMVGEWSQLTTVLPTSQIVNDVYPEPILSVETGSTATPEPILAPQSSVLMAQVTPANDGTNTSVIRNGNQFNIQGGQLSGDRTNLFHSFSEFGLTQGQIANFLANPQLRNVLGRVVGGDPSVINGQIQVTGGNANLFLLNPAGIVFGASASLNVGGSFTATTANGIQLGDRWFDAVGANNYTTLNGTPNGFAFTMSQPGTVINTGDLAVASGQNLSLVGGTVINTGQLSALGGQITVAAVPGENLVRISQPGHLLSLEIEPTALSQRLQNWNLPIATLPQLLTGTTPEITPGLSVNPNGQAVLTTTNTPIPNSPGTTVISGQVDVSDSRPGQTGGTAAILGDRIGIFDAQINAAGRNGGGTVLLGGDYQGQGTVPNATQTFVNSTSTINANAMSRGNGGRVIAWADDATYFYGNVSVQGGTRAGNGGFVEVSGADFLDYRGQVDASAVNGDRGTLLLDPTNIQIVDSTEFTAALEDVDAFADPDQGENGTLLSVDAINSASADVVLQATNNITFDAEVIIGSGYDLTAQAGNNITVNQPIDTSGGDLTFVANDPASGAATGTGAVIVRADIDTSSGNFNSTSASFNTTPNSTIRTDGGDLRIRTTNGNLVVNDLTAEGGEGGGDGGDIALTSDTGSIQTGELISRGDNGGLIDVTANGNVTVNGAIDSSGSNGNGGAVEITSTNGTITTQNIFSTAQEFSSEFAVDAGTVTLLTNGDISTGEIRANFGFGYGSGSDADIQLTSRSGDLNVESMEGRDITLTGRNVQFLQTGESLPTLTSNGGRLLIQPASSGQNLTLQTSNPNVFQNGFSDITIGRVDGAGRVTIADAITFLDPVVVRSPLGSLQIDGTLRGLDDASITLIGSGSTTTLNADIITSGTPITINDSVILGNNVLLDTTNDAAGANITITGAINGTSAGSQGLTLQAGTGTIAFGNAIGSTVPLRELQVLNARRVEVGGDITTTNGNILFQNVGDRVSVNNTATFSSGTQSVILNNANLATNSNSLTINANEIDFLGQSQVSGTGNLILQPATSSLSMTLGGTEDSDTNTLDLTQQDLNALQDGFNSITIGRANSSGAIAILNNLTFADSVTIRTPVGAGSITETGTSITGTDNSSITLLANQDIAIGDVTAPGGITITSNRGSVRTGNLDSSADRGGAIQVAAGDRIQSGQINSSSSGGNGGDVRLRASDGVQVTSINAQGGEAGIGGNVNIATGQFFQATESFLDQNNIDASISAAGGSGEGTITIRHGGGSLDVPFDVGDASTNGTAGALTTGNSPEGTIFPFRSFPGSYSQGNIRIITADPPESPESPEPPVQPPEVTPPSSPPEVPPLATTTLTPLKTLDDAREILQSIEESTGVRPALIYVQFVPAPTPAGGRFNEREAAFTQAFEGHLQGVESSLQTAQDTDELEILMVTAEGTPIARRMRGVTRSQVMAIANQFRREVSDVRKTRTRSYLNPAQALYNWLIAPIEAELQTQGIQNLVFLPDAGLRSVPLAALHDGSEFLVQQYSVGLMPSLSLADTRYVDIRDSEVLAMGASEFINQTALPAVPVELSAIADQLWQGEAFLNQNFTPENLRLQRQQVPFGIVHLATHAEFEPGTPDNSYIQFWNSQLRLDQLRQLGLNNPAVNLMVLSACRTALGNEDAELGFAGLATQAGVKSVMASLWYVSDAGTLALMTEFYTQLRTAPIKAEALRQAQLLMATGQVRLLDGQLLTPSTPEPTPLPYALAELGDTDFSHPYYWSSFTMVGNPW